MNTEEKILIEEDVKPAPAEELAENAPAQKPEVKAKQEITYNPAPEFTTVISAGTQVTGQFVSCGDVHVAGKLDGKVSTLGNVFIDESLKGDIVCNCLTFTKGKIEGNLTVKDTMSLAENATLIGDVSAQNLSSNGVIEGKAKISGKSSFLSMSRFNGKLCTAIIKIETGSKVCGEVNLAK